MVEVLFAVWGVITVILAVVGFAMICAFIEVEGFYKLRKLRQLCWFVIIVVLFWPLIIPTILIAFLFGYNFGQGRNNE